MATAEMRRERSQPSFDGTPDLEVREEVAELMRAMRRLSPSQRAAIALHYQADLPVKEVARLMGSSVGAVKVHLHWGRRRLRELLGSEEEDIDA